MTTEKCLLLCFRGLGHYWPLVMRQLALPPKLIGESLPYRDKFLYDSLETLMKEAPKKKALICLKIDGSETVGGKSLYVPLRTGVVEQATAATNAAGLLSISYKAGYTPDYRGKDCLAYSGLVREAVEAATGTDEPGDDALAVMVELDLSELKCADEKEESDRWTRLSRAVGVESEALTAWLKDNEKTTYKAIYNYLMFVRWSGIREVGEKPLKIGSDGYKLTVGQQYDIEMLSSLPPDKEFASRIFRWQLRGSPKHFDFFDWSTEVGLGITYHTLPLEPKRAAKKTSLRLSPSAPQTRPPGNSGDAAKVPHQFDVHIAFQVNNPLWMNLFLFVVVSFLAVGVILASGVVDKEWAEPLGLSSEWALRVQDWAPGLGAALLIGGALGSYWLTARRID